MPHYGKNDTAGRIELVDRFIELGVRDWLPVLPYPNGSHTHHFFNTGVVILSGCAHKIDLQDEAQLRAACAIGMENIGVRDLYKEWRLLIAKIEKDWNSREQQQPTE